MSTKKKSPAKKAAVKKTFSSKAKTTGNKELDKMLAKIAESKKEGKKSVTVFTTNKDSYKANGDSQGLSASDLKPKLLGAYKYLLVNTNLVTKALNLSTKSVEWTVKN